MLERLKLLIILFLLPVFGCTQPSKADSLEAVLPTPTVKKMKPVENEKLFVFVGEKISVEPIPPKEGEIPFDNAFLAKYKVIENVYNNYGKETIEFQAFDHYGFPPFANNQYVLLFVSEYKGKLFHEKYQFYDVNQTKDGRWASCGDPYRFDDYHRKSFEPAVLEFNEPVTFDLEKMEREQVTKVYPEPFFKIEGNKAVCKLGAFVEDLFMVKKNGVLKARGLFK
jgi:hypothetical protein